MKVSDEIGCAIICFVWELFFMLATIINTPLAWVVFGFVTVVEVIIIYFDWRNEQAKNEAKRNRQSFSRQTENYLKTIYESGAAEHDD